jgi:antitoxin MazE
VLPKAILNQADLNDHATAEIQVVNGAIVLRKPTQSVRAGWAEAAAAVGSKGEGALLMGEFGNLDDTELKG